MLSSAVGSKSVRYISPELPIFKWLTRRIMKAYQIFYSDRQQGGRRIPPLFTVIRCLFDGILLWYLVPKSCWRASIPRAELLVDRNGVINYLRHYVGDFPQQPVMCPTEANSIRRITFSVVQRFVYIMQPIRRIFLSRRSPSKLVPSLLWSFELFR